MTPNDYADAVRRVLEHLETTQAPAVEQAADLVIAALKGGGAIFVDTIGHGNEGDFLNRAGGLAAVRKFSWSLNVSTPVASCLEKRPGGAAGNIEAETIRLALRAGNVRPGDVMVVSSVSGRNSRPVELCLACREAGVRTIAMTSRVYSAKVESLHASGRKLMDVADVVIDNGAPYGDAAVAIAGYDIDLLPISGVSMTVAGWMVWGRVMEKMAAGGDPATVFMSVNRPGGKEFHEKAVAQFNQRGY